MKFYTLFLGEFSDTLTRAVLIFKSYWVPVNSINIIECDYCIMDQSINLSLISQHNQLMYQLTPHQLCNYVYFTNLYSSVFMDY